MDLRIVSGQVLNRYEPKIIKCTEIISGTGKKRTISNLAIVDRFITRLLCQKMKRYIESDFLPKSFAYQEGKGVLEAVLQAQTYLNQGNMVVVELDIHNFFDEISLEKTLQILEEKIEDDKIVQLIQSYLYCKTLTGNQISEKRKGLIQGNAISPILSNMYLNSFDDELEQQGYNWIRFADNIYVFTTDRESGRRIFNELSQNLIVRYKLPLNEKKSGVYDAMTRRILGYEFYKKW